MYGQAVWKVLRGKSPHGDRKVKSVPNSTRCDMGQGKGETGISEHIIKKAHLS